MNRKRLATNKPSEETLLALFKNIESGKVAITLDRIASAEALTYENGIYHYDTSNKWRIGVYVYVRNLIFDRFIEIPPYIATRMLN